MIKAMAEGLAKSGGETDLQGIGDRDWMIHAVESMLRQAFPTLIIVGAGGAIYFNDACRALLPLSTIQGGVFAEMAPSLSTQLAATVANAWGGDAGTADDINIHIDRPDAAREIWVTAAVTPIARNGKVHAVLCVLRDVTEERSLRARLLSAESTLDSLTNLAPLLLWRLDSRGVIRWLSERCQTYLGADLKQARTDGWIGWLHPAERDGIIADWGRALTLARPFESRHRLRRADGAYRWFTVRTLPQFDAGGELSGWHSAAVEALDAETIAPERRLLWTVDVSDWTRRFLNIDTQAAWSSDRPSVMAWSDQLAAVLEEDRPAFRAALETLMTGRPTEAAYRVRDKSGSLLSVEDTAFPLIEADGTISRFVGESRIRTQAGRAVLFIDPARRGCQVRRALEREEIRVDVAGALDQTLRTRTGVQTVVYCSDSTVVDILRATEVVGRELPDTPLVILGDPLATPREIIALHNAGVADLLSYADSDHTNVSAIVSHCKLTRLDSDLALPSRPTKQALARLSRREQEILELAVEGGTSKTIGRALGISPRTVDYHRGKALDKLGLKTVSQASDLFTPAPVRLQHRY
ncbi:PAS domain-containing protein [uncultured Brevundimonas sp.]|uniref:PAS domain-containing protein n=1 Tax=uncultured Brevundimonas sp. TaxID=213418 RepID=UPI0025D66547|nr:PAS domain-containing protein [uncultured Brevundimonas sp.]